MQLGIHISLLTTAFLAGPVAFASSAEFNLNEIYQPAVVEKISAVFGISNAEGEIASNPTVNFSGIKIDRMPGPKDVVSGALKFRFTSSGFNVDHLTGPDSAHALDVEKDEKSDYFTFRHGGVWRVKLSGFPCKADRSCDFVMKDYQVNSVANLTKGAYDKMPVVGLVAQTPAGIDIGDAINKSRWLHIPGGPTVDALGQLKGAQFEGASVLKLTFRMGIMLLDFVGDTVVIVDNTGGRIAHHAISNPNFGDFRGMFERRVDEATDPYAKEKKDPKGDLKSLVQVSGRQYLAVYGSGHYASFDLDKPEESQVKTFASPFAGVLSVNGNIFAATLKNNIGIVWQYLGGQFMINAQYSFVGDKNLAGFVDGYFYSKDGSLYRPFTAKAQTTNTSLNNLSDYKLEFKDGKILARSGGKDACKLSHFRPRYIFKQLQKTTDEVVPPTSTSFGKSVRALGKSISCGKSDAISSYSSKAYYQGVMTSLSEKGDVLIRITFFANGEV